MWISHRRTIQRKHFIKRRTVKHGQLSGSTTDLRHLLIDLTRNKTRQTLTKPDIKQVAAKVAEAEAKLLQRKKIQEEAVLRKQSDRLIGMQRVATAKSGIQMSGSPLQALADAYFNTELDAINIQQASKIEQFAKTAEANLARAEGSARKQAYRTQAYTTLLSAGKESASLLS